jgi:hypothetical protein
VARLSVGARSFGSAMDRPILATPPVSRRRFSSNDLDRGNRGAVLERALNAGATEVCGEDHGWRLGRWWIPSVSIGRSGTNWQKRRKSAKIVVLLLS